MSRPFHRAQPEYNDDTIVHLRRTDRDMMTIPMRYETAKKMIAFIERTGVGVIVRNCDGADCVICWKKPLATDRRR